MATESAKQPVHAAILFHGVKCSTQKAIKASFTVSLQNTVLYTSPENATPSCNATWPDKFSINLNKRQAEEGILEFTFLEKKSTIGMAQIPLRTLCSKHYVERAAASSNLPGLGESTKVKPRIVTTAGKADIWQGFEAQLLKTDTIRGSVHVDTECTSVASIQELLSAYKTYFIGVDNLLHLAQFNPTKLALYITPDLLNMLKVATLSQKMDTGSNTSISPKRRARASTRVSKVSVGDGQALALLEQAFQENEPDPEDRYLLLALWRHLLSCSDGLIKVKLEQCGLYKIIGKMLSVKDDPELVIHFLEGLKYFFMMPKAQQVMIKKKKQGLNIQQRLIEIVSLGATTPTQGQVVMRAMDLLYYFDDADASKALIDNGLLAALQKLFTDASAFLALRTKALDLFKIFPPEAHKAILASGIMAGFAETISSPSTRTTHHSFLGRVLGFLNFLSKASVSNLASDNIFKSLIALLTAKNSIEANKLSAIAILTNAVSAYSSMFIELGLPKNLLSLLVDVNTSPLLRTAIMEHLSLQPYMTEEARSKLIQGGMLQLMFDLLSTSRVEDESAMARKFVSSTPLKLEDLKTSGLLTALDLMVSYDTLDARNDDTVCFRPNLTTVMSILQTLGAGKQVTELATASTIPKSLADIMKRAHSLCQIPFITNVQVAVKTVVEFAPSLPLALVMDVLQILPLIPDDAFYANNLHALCLILRFCHINKELTALCDKELLARKEWTEKIDKPLFFSLLKEGFVDYLRSTEYVIGVLRDLPNGFGHIEFLFELVKTTERTKPAFDDLLLALPGFEAYLEFLNHELFLDTFMCVVSNPKAVTFYRILQDEAAKVPSLKAKLLEPARLMRFLGLLSDAIFTLKNTSGAGYLAECCTKIRDVSFYFLSTAPHVEEILQGETPYTFILTLITEPVSGPAVTAWALALLDARIGSIDAATATNINLHETLWNIVTGCDLSVKDSPGDGRSTYSTQASIAAWKLLCKCPDYLTWLYALPIFLKTVTTWFFSNQPDFQLMAISIVEPVRWARAGCKTKEEFEAWRLNLNKGRLAFCSSIKDANLKEVAKLARSFAHNGVVPEDLSWTTNEAEMATYLKLYLEIDEQLKPPNQTEQAKEHQTLIQWLKFLRLCQQGDIKRRFIALLDTFHDSLFFLPDTAPANTDWHKYYDVSKGELESSSALKQSTLKASTNYRSVMELRTSASRAITSAVSKGLSTVSHAVVAKWRPNTAAHFQLLRFWQFTAISTTINPLDTINPAHYMYELCYDSFQHGFDLDTMRQRTNGLNKLMLVAHIEPQRDNDPALGKNGVFLCFYIPTGYVWSNNSSAQTHQSKLIAFSFRNMDHAAQTATNNWCSTASSTYNLNTSGNTISVMSDTHEFTLDLANHLVSFSPNGSWQPKLWGGKQVSDIPMTHIQVFRVVSVTSNTRISVISRKGFGQANATPKDDRAAAASSTATTLGRALSSAIGGLFDDSPSPSPSASGVLKREKAGAATTPESEPEPITPQDAESFMNRYLAKTMNQALDEHYARVTSKFPALKSTVPTGPKPNWIRIYRHSARPINDFRSVNIYDIIRGSSSSGSPLIGIVKMRPADVQGDGQDRAVQHKPSYVFGFYIHSGIDVKASSGPFIRDPLAMLFSLRGPSGKGPIFAPVAVEEAQHAYRLVNDTVLQFGLGTDLYLNLTDHASSFSNPGATFMLPEDMAFMTREAQTLFTDDAPTTWQFDDIELYFRTNPRSKISLPYPSLGHLLRLLGQSDIGLLQQVRWRLKYLMISGSIENKRQMLDEIRRAQMADMKAGVLEPVNNLTKKIEHPGVDKLVCKVVAVNGELLKPEQQEALQNLIFNPGNGAIMAPPDVAPFDVTLAVLPPFLQDDVQDISLEQIEKLDINALPYLTHTILSSLKNADPNGERAQRAVIFATDFIVTSAQINSIFFPTHTPIDEYAKVIKANAKDHLRWYEQHAPSALDPSTQFRIGPLLMPAEEKLSKEDTGLVSKSEDNFWSFLKTQEDETDLKAKALPVPGRQAFVEDYTLDRLRATMDPIAMITVADNAEIGTAVLSAPTRARYITIRFLPNANNSQPIYFSALRLLGYHPENNHFLVPPKPEAMSDVLPIYTDHLIVASNRLNIPYQSDETAGVLHWLRDTRHKGDIKKFETEFDFTLSHTVFDPKAMTKDMFYNTKRPTTFFWGGSAPTWFSFTFTSVQVSPRTFMLRHGYGKNNSFVQNFIFQGTTDGGKSWTDIKSFPDHYHSYSGQAYIFTLEDTNDTPITTENEVFYNGFRVYQKGPYFMGPGIAGSPFFCCSEFEVFGAVQLASPEDSKVTKTVANVDVDAALGFKSAYDKPISSLIAKRSGR